MDNCNFKLINNKRVLIYNGSTYNYSVSRDKTFINYKCIVTSCKANIKLNSNRTAIIDGNYTHDGHSAKSSPNLPSSSPNTTSSIEKNKKVLSLTPFARPLTRLKAAQEKILISKLQESQSPCKATPQEPNASAASPLSSQSQVQLPCSGDEQVTRVSNPAEQNQAVLLDVHHDCLSEKHVLEAKLSDQEAIISNLMDELDRLRELLSNKKHDNSHDITYSAMHTTTCTFKDKKPNTCFLVGDSHIRGLSGLLRSTLPKGIKTNSFFQSGAGLKEIADTHRNSPSLMQPVHGDDVILCGGTNDICSTQWNVIQNALDFLLLKFQNCSRFIFICIPLQYKHKKVNFHIKRLNSKLKTHLKSKCGNLIFIDPNRFIKPRHYARDGVHFNKQGKSILENKLKNALYQIPYSNNTLAKTK